MNELTNTTEPQIAYSECYAQPFLLFNESNLDTMKRMPDNFIDLTVTSPPYDDLRTYKGYCFDFENVAKELFRVTKQGGVVVWIVNDSTKNGSESLTSFKQAIYFVGCGFNLHDTMIYKKKNPIPLNHNRYEQSFEYMFVFSKGKPKTFNPIMEDCVFAGKDIVKNRTFYQTDESKTSKGHKNKPIKEQKIKQNIFEYSLYGGKKDFIQGAVFPEQLATDQIISWSNEGDIVYDPFAGSGTTGKMAILNKRKCIMSEISAEYCDIIKKRLEPIINERTLF
jgi:site-specific DNA-methyltransferase (adenine-specific)